MSRLDEILDYNQKFVERKEYISYITDKYPNKKILVVTCMDARLTELLPKALNLKNGDAKIIKVAGAIVSEPYGNIMRSILVGVSILKAEEIYVIGHDECGMIGMDADKLLASLKRQGVTDEQVAKLYEQGVQLNQWLKGYHSVEEGVMKSIQVIQNHPLLPKNILVHGLIIHPVTGKLRLIHKGCPSAKGVY